LTDDVLKNTDEAKQRKPVWFGAVSNNYSHQLKFGLFAAIAVGGIRFYPAIFEQWNRLSAMLNQSY
jgi:hypothetical protein